MANLAQDVLDVVTAPLQWIGLMDTPEEREAKERAAALQEQLLGRAMDYKPTKIQTGDIDQNWGVIAPPDVSQMRAAQAQASRALGAASPYARTSGTQYAPVQMGRPVAGGQVGGAIPTTAQARAGDFASLFGVPTPPPAPPSPLPPLLRDSLRDQFTRAERDKKAKERGVRGEPPPSKAGGGKPREFELSRADADADADAAVKEWLRGQAIPVAPRGQNTGRPR